MSYETYRLIFLGGAGLAAAMVILAVVLFFVLKIPNVIGDLTGRNARKAIENIRNQNAESGQKAFKPSAVNRERSKTTDKMTPSGRLERKRPDGNVGAMPTGKLNTTDLAAEAARAAGDTTGNETVLLSNETVLLQPQGNETVFLGSQSSETTLLQQPAPAYAPAPAAVSPFAIEYELTYIHSDEIIA